MNDQETSVAQLKALMAEFVARRGWQKHHKPKHLAGSILIEAGELMEHFQWDPVEDGPEIATDARRLQGIREEMADVLAYLLSMANAMDIDLANALEEKMIKNGQKYPVGHAGVARPGGEEMQGKGT